MFINLVSRGGWICGGGAASSSGALVLACVFSDIRSLEWGKRDLAISSNLFTIGINPEYYIAN